MGHFFWFNKGFLLVGVVNIQQCLIAKMFTQKDNVIFISLMPG